MCTNYDRSALQVIGQFAGPTPRSIRDVARDFGEQIPLLVLRGESLLDFILGLEHDGYLQVVDEGDNTFARQYVLSNKGQKAKEYFSRIVGNSSQSNNYHACT